MEQKETKQLVTAPTLDSYLRKKKMTMQELSNMTGICYSRLSAIRHTESPSISLKTIISIWQTTKDKFGEGLTPQEYLNIPEFWVK
jgi:DNA-binding Xre family transcriptional regulator